jgi:hypothetical protein
MNNFKRAVLIIPNNGLGRLAIQPITDFPSGCGFLTGSD